MNTPTQTDLRQAFKSVGIKKGDIVFIHSSLYKIGGITNITIDEIPQVVTSTLMDVVGPSGGLYVPTFTYDFCEGEPFDIQSTPSEMGVLTEHIRKQARAVRSPHPMQSIAGIGPDTDDICRRDTRTTFSSGGPIDALYKRDAKVLLIGAAFQMTSLVHYVEEQYEVPYRYWKEFEGKYIDRDGNASYVTYEMYVRDLDIDPQLDLSIIECELPETAIQRARVGSAQVASFSFEDFVQQALELVSEDPFALVGEMGDSTQPS